MAFIPHGASAPAWTGSGRYALVRLRARQNDIAMQTLASHDELCKVARGYTEGVSVLKGWRREMVGEELLDLLAGRLSLRLDGPELGVERR